MFLIAIVFTTITWGQTYLSESFEGTWSGIPAAPSGWSIIHTAPTGGSSGTSPKYWVKNTWSGSAWSPSGYGTPTIPTGAQNGSSVAWFDDYNAKATQKDQITTGNVDLSSSTNPRLTFYLAINASSSVTIKVRGSNDGGSTWADIQTVTNPGVAWTKIIVPISATYKVSNAKFGIEVTTTYGSYDVWLDNFIIDETPSPLTGIKTIKTSGGDYSSFTSAINALNDAGTGTGGITFDVDADFISTENCPAITASGSSSDPIIFQKSGSGANPIIKAGTGSGSSDAIVTLKGCDYVTFDGIDLQENSSNTTTTQQAEYGFYVLNNGATNGAQNNTIKNSKITLNRTNTSTKAIYQYYGTTPTNQATGCNNSNKYYNLTIENSYSAIYLYSYSSTYFDSGTEVGVVSGGTTTIGGSSANDIGNSSSSSYGIYAYYQSGIKIFNTEIRNIGASTNVYGICLSSCAGNNEVYNNKIHDLKNTSTSNTSAVYGLYTSLSGTTPSVSIYNNLIYNLSSAYTGSASSTKTLTGIYLSNGTASQSFYLYFNNVKIDGSASLNVSSTCFQSTGTTTGGILTLKNNIFANVTAAQSGIAKHYSWFSPSATSIGPAGCVSDYNDLYSAPTSNGFLGLANSTDIADLATWSSTLSGTTDLERNSINPPVDPGFSPNLTPIASDLDGKGIAVSGITTDITGSLRNDPPDYGAIEFTPPNPCQTPADQPTALSLTSVSTSSISGSFSASPTGADGYIVVRSTSSHPDADPQDGVTYSVGSSIGSGTVVKADDQLTFTANGLTAGTQYYFYIYSFNSVCQGGPVYNISSPLLDNQYSLPNAPASLTASVISSTQIDLTPTANAQSNDIIIAWNTTNTFGTPTGNYLHGDVISGGGTILYVGPATTFSHMGLNSATTYYYKTWSNLGTLYSSGVSANATTLCNPESIPTSSQGFESTSLPVCWSTGLITGSTNWAPATSNDAVPSAHTGTYFMGKVYTTSDALIYSQPIDMTSSVNGGRINVWIYRSSSNISSDRIRFHINTIQSLTGATQLLEIFPKTTIAPTVTADGWYNYIVNIPNTYNTNSTIYIIAQGTTSGGYSSYGLGFDDFKVEEIPSCLEVTGLSSDNITYTSATINWTASVSNPSSGYEYEVRTNGTVGSGATGLVTSGATAAGIVTANISGLTANTTYSFYVRSNCGSGNYSAWSSAGTFFTGYCIPAPSSVDGIGITNVAFSTVSNATGAETGNYGNYSAMIGDIQQTLVVPVNITYETGYTYDTKIWIDWNDDLDFADAGEEIYSGTSTASDPTTLAASFTVPLTAPLGNHRMRIGGQDNGPVTTCYTGTYGTFEDYTVNVTAAPSCLAPTGVASSNISYTSTDFSWTAPALGSPASYEWEVRTSGAAGSGATGLVTSGSVSSLSTTITGLNAASTYTMYVRSNCGGGDFSVWTTGVAFTTTTCSLPTAVTASAITATSTTISWTAPASSPVGYEYEIRTSGAAGSGATGLITSGTTTAPTVSANITGLTASTQYYVYVRSNCVASVYGSWTSSVSFTTTCIAVQIFPFTENFVGGNILPSTCWTKSGGQLTASTVLTGTGSWVIDDYLNVTSPVNKCARDNVYGTSHYSWLITPQLDLGDGSKHYRLSFNLGLTAYGATTTAAQTGTDDKFAVVISTDGGITWSNANTLRLWDNAGSSYVYNNIPNTGQTVVLDLASYTGTVKIGFYGESTVSNADNDLFVDDIRVSEIPTNVTWTGTTNSNWTNGNNWNPENPATTTDVTIPGGITNYPTITSTATIASLTLESGASIIGEENLTITGTTTYKKDIDANKWHLISSPVSTGATAANFQPTTGNGWLRSYTDGTGWGGYITVTTTPLIVGEGYALYLEQPKSVVLTGTLNNGNYNLPLLSGWNMLGNPYASGVDFALATKTNVSSNTMYLWDQTFAVANAGGYVSYNTNSSVGNAPGVTSVIPAFQGFFVEATAAGSVEFANANRTHNAPAFYKSGSSTEIITRMKVSNAQGYTDYFVVCQNPSAGNGYESYDSKKFLAGTERPEMFAYTTTGEKLTIDALETTPQIIPMSVIAPQAGSLTFTAFEFDNSTVSIKLEDNQTGSFIDLRTQPSYSFSAIQGENNNRFFLHIGSTTGIEENDNNGFTSITANDKQIVVTPFGGEKINRIDVVDATGKLLSSVKASGNEKVTISANFATGVYMVRVYGQGKVMTGKVTIW